jgi:methylase of polypeptide subunit release factors
MDPHEPAGTPQQVFPTVRAMLVEARLRELAEAFSIAKVPALLLTPLSLTSTEESLHFPLQVLTRPRWSVRARRVMDRLGWELFWYAPGSTHFERDHIGLDLLSHVAFPRTPGALARALWADTVEGTTGLLEPRPEPVVVLAAWSRSIVMLPRQETIRLFLSRVRNWGEIWGLAEVVDARDEIEAAVGESPSSPTFRPPEGWLWRVATLLSRARLRFRERPLHPFSCDFMGLSLHLGLRVFHPQPTAERMVDVALRLIEGIEQPTVVDVGTGCGAVALAVASGRPDAEVHGIDISKTAIRNARRNARRTGRSDVAFHLGSLLQPVSHLEEPVDLVTSVLPYLPSDAAGSAEQLAPRVALDGGPDGGLHLTRELASQVPLRLKPGGWWLLQQTEGQWESFSSELSEMGYTPRLFVRWPGRVVLAGAQWLGAD